MFLCTNSEQSETEDKKYHLQYNQKIKYVGKYDKICAKVAHRKLQNLKKNFK